MIVIGFLGFPLLPLHIHGPKMTFEYRAKEHQFNVKCLRTPSRETMNRNYHPFSSLRHNNTRTAMLSSNLAVVILCVQHSFLFLKEIQFYISLRSKGLLKYKVLNKV